jgi:hypothetical protein
MRPPDARRSTPHRLALMASRSHLSRWLLLPVSTCCRDSTCRSPALTRSDDLKAMTRTPAPRDRRNVPMQLSNGSMVPALALVNAAMLKPWG